MDAGFNLHDTMIYQKSGFAYPSNNRYHQVFEYMFVLSKGSPKTSTVSKTTQMSPSAGAAAKTGMLRAIWLTEAMAE